MNIARYREGTAPGKLICRECSTRTHVVEVYLDDILEHDAEHEEDQ